MTVGVHAFLVFAAILFCVGLFGALSKKSVIQILMSLEVMAVAVNINLIAFSRFITPELMTGQYFTIFAMVVSAAEIGLGLALVIAIFRATKRSEVQEMNELRG